MGNRAVITTKKALDEGKGTSIYLHWNGGRDSVEGFLAFCKARGYRSPSEDSYGWAYLATTIGNFFGDGLSLGIEDEPYDPGDNGIYVIEGWRIVGRRGQPTEEQNEHNIRDMLHSINDRQPERMRLTEEQIEQAVKDYYDSA